MRRYTRKEWENAFWRHIKIMGLDECWNWIGKSKLKFGYGTFRECWTRENGRGKMRGSHVIAFKIVRGDTRGLHVLHSCDNPSCCNPIHLFLGTQLQNMQDMIGKGRKVINTGREHPNAKLNDSLVARLRKLYKPYDRQFSAGALARKYGVSEGNMLKILTGKAWTHVH